MFRLNIFVFQLNNCVKTAKIYFLIRYWNFQIQICTILKEFNVLNLLKLLFSKKIPDVLLQNISVRKKADNNRIALYIRHSEHSYQWL